jgi:hypothetical protein
MSEIELGDVEPERRAAVAEDHAVVMRRAWEHKNRRPPALTAREALAALKFEALFVWVAATNVARGVVLSDVDAARLTAAARFIHSIATEAGT